VARALVLKWNEVEASDSISNEPDGFDPTKMSMQASFIRGNRGFFRQLSTFRNTDYQAEIEEG
jgi:hypothetical protein